VSAPVGQPAAPFGAGQVYLISITPVEGSAGMVDHDTNTIFIDPSVADNADTVAHMVRSAWDAIREDHRPKLTVVEGGSGRRTKRRGNLRLVGA
jgi:hypothetical protein